MVKSKIDPLNGDSARVENPFEHGSGLTGHSQNRPVMIPVRVNVQQRASRVSPQHPSDLVDAVPVPAFADIENAFYELHECLVPPGQAGPGTPEEARPLRRLAAQSNPQPPHPLNPRIAKPNEFEILVIQQIVGPEIQLEQLVQSLRDEQTRRRVATHRVELRHG